MLSRVADNIYWMARYVERAENVARIAQVNYLLTLDSVIEQKQQWEPLVSIMGDEKAFYERHKIADESNVIRFLITDRDNWNSVFRCLWAARENARGVRDQISDEAWLQLNKLYLHCKALSEVNGTPSQEFFDEIRNGAHLFFGLVADTMNHDESYRWVNLGRYLERADKTSRLIDVKYFILLPEVTDVGTPIDLVQWNAVLKSVSAFHTYLRIERRIDPERVVAFLLQNQQFPRSVLYSVRRSHRELLTLFGDGHELSADFTRLEEMLSNPDIKSILNRGLHEFIDEVQLQLNNLHGEIHQRFFSLERAS